MKTVRETQKETPTQHEHAEAVRRNFKTNQRLTYSGQMKLNKLEKDIYKSYLECTRR